MTNLRWLLCLALATPLGACEDDDPCELGPEAGRAPEVLYRNPDTGVCESRGGGGSRTLCGDDYATGDGNSGAAFEEPLPNWPLCEGHCTGLTEDACLTTDGCQVAYETECPDNIADGECDTLDQPALAFIGCWQTTVVGPVATECGGLVAVDCAMNQGCSLVYEHLEVPPAEPGGDFYNAYSFVQCIAEEDEIDPEVGSCVGEVACDELPPDCPMDTIPGRDATCWTGYCIPLAQCDQIPACSDMDEMMCIDRSDCAPIYEGVNCTCDEVECTCEDWLYDTCTEDQP